MIKALIISILIFLLLGTILFIMCSLKLAKEADEKILR